MDERERQPIEKTMLRKTGNDFDVENKRSSPLLLSLKYYERYINTVQNCQAPSFETGSIAFTVSQARGAPSQ